MKNREINEHIEIKFIEEERVIFENKMKLAKCKTMSHFIRKCVMEGYIYIIDLELFRDLREFLEKVSNNIKSNRKYSKLDRCNL